MLKWMHTPTDIISLHVYPPHKRSHLRPERCLFGLPETCHANSTLSLELVILLHAHRLPSRALASSLSPRLARVAHAAGRGIGNAGRQTLICG